MVVNLLRNMDPDSPERFPYLNGAIRWTMKVDTDHRAGHPNLHQKCGMLFWQGKVPARELCIINGSMALLAHLSTKCSW